MNLSWFPTLFLYLIIRRILTPFPQGWTIVPQKDRRGDPDEYCNECDEGVPPAETEIAISSWVH